MGPLLHTRQHAWGRGAGQTQASGKVTRCRNQVTRRRAREKEDENKGAIVAGSPLQVGVRASQGGVEKRALLSHGEGRDTCNVRGWVQVLHARNAFTKNSDAQRESQTLKLPTETRFVLTGGP